MNTNFIKQKFCSVLAFCSVMLTVYSAEATNRELMEYDNLVTMLNEAKNTCIPAWTNDFRGFGRMISEKCGLAEETANKLISAAPLNQKMSADEHLRFINDVKDHIARVGDLFLVFIDISNKFFEASKKIEVVRNMFKYKFVLNDVRNDERKLEAREKFLQINRDNKDEDIMALYKTTEEMYNTLHDNILQPLEKTMKNVEKVWNKIKNANERVKNTVQNMTAYKANNGSRLNLVSNNVTRITVVIGFFQMEFNHLIEEEKSFFNKVNNVGLVDLDALWTLTPKPMFVVHNKTPKKKECQSWIGSRENFDEIFRIIKDHVGDGEEKKARELKEKVENERQERARQEQARIERERQEQARIERERQEQARQEQARQEQARIEGERQEQARIERERQEQEERERRRQAEGEQARIEREMKRRADERRAVEEEAKREHEARIKRARQENEARIKRERQEFEKLQREKNINDPLAIARQGDPIVEEEARMPFNVARAEYPDIPVHRAKPLNTTNLRGWIGPIVLKNRTRADRVLAVFQETAKFIRYNRIYDALIASINAVRNGNHELEGVIKAIGEYKNGKRPIDGQLCSKLVDLLRLAEKLNIQLLQLNRHINDNIDGLLMLLYTSDKLISNNVKLSGDDNALVSNIINIFPMYLRNKVVFSIDDNLNNDSQLISDWVLKNKMEKAIEALNTGDRGQLMNSVGYSIGVVNKLYPITCNNIKNNMVFLTICSTYITSMGEIVQQYQKQHGVPHHMQYLHYKHGGNRSEHSGAGECNQTAGHPFPHVFFDHTG